MTAFERMEEKVMALEAEAESTLQVRACLACPKYQTAGMFYFDLVAQTLLLLYPMRGIGSLCMAFISLPHGVTCGVLF